MKIRIANENDIKSITSIIKKSYQTVADRFDLTFENCPKHPSNCTMEWVENDLERGVEYFVLESPVEPIGCAALEVASPALCYLERLAVTPEHRHNGYGKHLVDYIIDRARSKGCRAISIGIIAHQQDLKNWYAKLGFVEGITKTFAHLPFNVTFMEARI